MTDPPGGSTGPRGRAEEWECTAAMIALIIASGELETARRHQITVRCASHTWVDVFSLESIIIVVSTIKIKYCCFFCFVTDVLESFLLM